jgi:hypothetical protein
MLWKIDGYLAIPHELLHVLAYRLIGKKCSYSYGEHFVRALSPLTFAERLLVLLFPLFILGGTALIFQLLWAITYLLIGFPPQPINYFRVAPMWHKLLWVVSVILMLYSGSSVMDIVMAVRLVFQKLRQ